MRLQFAVLLAALIFLLLLQCAGSKNKQDNMALRSDYKTLWKQIDSLEADGLPESARKKTLLIYEKALKENDEVNTIKSLIYLAKYGAQLDEAGLLASIKQIESELKSGSRTSQSIKHSLLADLYQHYFRSNIWVIRGRTPVFSDSLATGSPETWSVLEFLQKIRKHHLNAVDYPGLKNEPVSEYLALLTDGENSDSLRPFLYDILAHRALDYFMQGMSDMDLTAEDYRLDDPRLFAQTGQFLRLNPQFRQEEPSFYGQVIHLFQSLEDFHQKDVNPAAYLDVVQKRIQYVYEHFSGEGKDKLYESSLDQWISLYPRQPGVFYLLKANLYTQWGYRYEPFSEDSIYRPWLERARTVLEQVIAKYPETREAALARNQLIALLQIQIQGQAEQVNVTGQPFRMFVQYRNAPMVYVRIVRVSDTLRKRLQFNRSPENIQLLLQETPVQSFQQALPAVEDLQEHRTELKIGALRPGMYAILLSNLPDLQMGRDAIALLYTHVSNLSYLYEAGYRARHADRKDSNEKLFIVDRTSGVPQEDVQAVFYEQFYNDRLRTQEWKEVQRVRSDKSGSVSPVLPPNKNYSVALIRGMDSLWLQDGFPHFSYDRNGLEEREDALLFLDRSLYRPGQMLYFKGLALIRDVNDQPRIQKNRKVTVSLHDANGQAVSKKIFISGDFGSFHGSFVLPSGGLSGSMSLVTDLNQASVGFQVEEYKRPRFEVTFDTAMAIYRLNEPVLVKGHAFNFAGNAVDQAMVRYTVTRERWIRPLPWWSWKIYFPQRSNPVIITKGETMTDVSGGFQVPFIALPETNMGNDQDQSYIFSVQADISDFSGETRSGITSMRIGKKNLVLQSDLGTYLPADQTGSFVVKATDLNDIPVQASGSWTLNQLEIPSTQYRKRYWLRPDQQVLAESEYRNLFPLDLYRNEDDLTTWALAKLIQSSPFQAGQPSRLNQPLRPGAYKLVAVAKDRYQQETEWVHYFWVYDLENKNLPSWKALQMLQDSTTLEPGQVMNYHIQFQTSHQHVLFTHSREESVRWLMVDGLTSDSVKIQEADRGKIFTINGYAVRDNRFYEEHLRYSIPWSDKLLRIETKSFRDQLLPGQKEEWTLKISGQAKEKFMAEVVASMYDQSLDEYYPHGWNTGLFYQREMPGLDFSAPSFIAVHSDLISMSSVAMQEIKPVIYRDLNWFGFEMGYYHYMRGRAMGMGQKVLQNNEVVPEAAQAADSKKDGTVPPGPAGPPQPPQVPSVITPRKNLNETVFFYPDILTDAEGNFSLHFTMNEALTKWRLMLFGHTQDLKSGYLEKSVTTRKDLMVFPNAPRFVRQGDVLILPAKINNQSDKMLVGNARLEIFDPISGKELKKEFGLHPAEVSFQAAPAQSAAVSWKIAIPGSYQGMLGYRVLAESGTYTDGEENILPVLSNRMLVTETLPIQVDANQSKSFFFDALRDKSNSGSLRHHRYTLEMTTNPAWYAIQALPYLMEYPYDCTEQIVNRMYANLLGAKIMNSNPAIRNIFEAWAKTDALKSPLQKNEELKNAVLAETPWVQDALSEQEQQKMIALFFDKNRLQAEKEKTIRLLQERQLSNGGFPWFGGRDDWYISQYILETFGQLKSAVLLEANLNEMVTRLIQYCDVELQRYYEEQKRLSGKNEVGLSAIAVHYLYVRSFFKENAIPAGTRPAFDYFLKESEKQWLKQNLGSQAMIALAGHRWNSDGAIPVKIIASLKEKAQHHAELGMYWKFDAGYRWFELPIETQVLLIEAFDQVTRDRASVEKMKLWLLKHKQTNHWPSTKSTAAAVNALVNFGNDWISETRIPELILGEESIKPGLDQVIPGIGYFKIARSAEQVNPSLAAIQVKNENNHIAWGSAYWQYFEDLDKITLANTLPLQMNKALYLEETEGSRKVLKSFKLLTPGDKVIVRIELKADRPMDYVHLKDMRAAGFEPAAVISEYKYQGGLFYFESTKDLATHFFFDHMSPGTYVLEYALRVSQKGDFSNGISSIQCMYAPEFSTHSAGMRIEVQ